MMNCRQATGAVVSGEGVTKLAYIITEESNKLITTV